MKKCLRLMLAVDEEEAHGENEEELVSEDSNDLRAGTRTKLDEER